MFHNTTRQLCLYHTTISVSVVQLLRVSPEYSEHDFSIILEAFKFQSKQFLMNHLKSNFDCKVKINFAVIVMGKRFGYYIKHGSVFRKSRNSSFVTYKNFTESANEYLTIAQNKYTNRLLSYVKPTSRA